MQFELSDSQQSICEGVDKLCEQFDDRYWLDHDDSGEFPFEFHKAMADGGWLGVAMPEPYGGSGLGITEAALVMHHVALGGGGMSAASAVHMNIFGPHPIVVFGTEEQRERFLPPLIECLTPGNILTGLTLA